MNPRSLLTDDHASLDTLLRGMEAALRDGNVQEIASKLDLFWARLAVHIRGEHLHLFPTILRALNSAGPRNLSDVSRAEAESAVGILRVDHDFFMRQLASALEQVRDQTAEYTSETTMLIGNIVREVESRLKSHNEIEETQIYPLAIKLLSEQQQFELANQIKHELTKQPNRFTAEVWLSET